MVIFETFTEGDERPGLRAVPKFSIGEEDSRRLAPFNHTNSTSATILV